MGAKPPNINGVTYNNYTNTKGAAPMAKESMITRTIRTTRAIVLCLDIETGEPCNRAFTIPRQPKKDKEVLKFAEAALAASEPNVHPVHVVDLDVCEDLYGMTESKFLANAEKITRTAKADAEKNGEPCEN